MEIEHFDRRTSLKAALNEAGLKVVEIFNEDKKTVITVSRREESGGKHTKVISALAVDIILTAENTARLLSTGKRSFL